MSDQFEPRSPYRVAVRDDFIGGGVSITFGIVHRWDGPTKVMHFNEDGVQSFTDHEPMTVIDKPSIRIQEEFARALYEQLGYYFQGKPNETSSRADYLHERERADNMFKEYALLANHALSTIDMAADMAASAGGR